MNKFVERYMRGEEKVFRIECKYGREREMRLDNGEHVYVFFDLEYPRVYEFFKEDGKFVVHSRRQGQRGYNVVEFGTGQRYDAFCGGLEITKEDFEEF